MKAAFHANPYLKHQVEHAEFFREGLRLHNIALKVTADITVDADVHIISGPHYAKDYWLGRNHPAVIEIDRAYYHQQYTGRFKSMDWMSVGIMTGQHSRVFYEGEGREPPEIESLPLGDKSIYLCDYNTGPLIHTDIIRRHPLVEKPSQTLREQLMLCNQAAGFQTTALVTAALMGLDINCLNPGHILNQPNWLNLLPYTDWHYSEIESGEAWQHLIEHSPQLRGLHQSR